MARPQSQGARGGTLQPEGILERGKLRNKDADLLLLLSSAGPPLANSQSRRSREPIAMSVDVSVQEAGWIKVERGPGRATEESLHSHPSDQNFNNRLRGHPKPSMTVTFIKHPGQSFAECLSLCLVWSSLDSE